jgi:hypothetical protein
MGTVSHESKFAYALVDPEEIEDVTAYDTVTEYGRCESCGRRTYRMASTGPWKIVAK